MRAPVDIDDLSEKEWEYQVIRQLARPLGWRCYHTLRSKGSQPGYPDWTLARERVIFLELKRESGKLTPAQVEWLTALLEADAEVYVARPRDLERVGKVLASRHRHITAADWLENELRKELEPA